MFWTQSKIKTATPKSKDRNTCRSRESNPGPLAPQSGALPLSES